MKKAKRKICALLTFALIANYCFSALASVSFSDISGHSAEEEIKYCAGKNYVQGFPGGFFKPDQYVTEAQLRVFSAAYVSANSEQSFSIVEAGKKWYANAVEILYNMGHIPSPNLESPDHILSTRDIIQALSELFEADGSQLLSDNGRNWDFPMTRAELCTLVYRYETQIKAELEEEENKEQSNASGLRAGTSPKGSAGGSGSASYAQHSLSIPIQGVPIDEGGGQKSIPLSQWELDRVSAAQSNHPLFEAEIQGGQLVIHAGPEAIGQESTITLQSGGETVTFTARGTDGSMAYPHIVSSYQDFIDSENLGLHKNYIQMADFDFMEQKGLGSTSQNPFTGFYNGNLHTIYNVEASEYNGGLFGYIGAQGVITDLNLMNAAIKTSHIPEAQSIGVIASMNEGKIENCNLDATIQIRGNRSFVGGITGVNKGEIKNLSADIYLNSGNVFGQTGGIAGINEGTISGIKVLMKATANTESENIGGITGYNMDGTIYGCDVSVNANISGNQIAAGGIVGNNDFGDIERCAVSFNAAGEGERLVIGGISSNNKGGTIKNVQVLSDFSVVNNAESIIGGITASNNSGGFITECETKGVISVSGATERAGIIAGENLQESLIVDCNAGQMKLNSTGSNDSLEIAGFNLGYIN